MGKGNKKALRAKVGLGGGKAGGPERFFTADGAEATQRVRRGLSLGKLLPAAMNPQAVEIIETEVVLEEVTSLNHSRLIHRISVALLPYEEQYDILPELEFELSAGRLKPDIALLPRQAYNYRKDVLRVVQPPVTAVEILSPTQSFDALADKILDEYLPSGVKSGWLVVPKVNTIYLFLPDQSVQAFTEGTLRDPATGIEVSLADIFR